MTTAEFIYPTNGTQEPQKAATTPTETTERTTEPTIAKTLLLERTAAHMKTHGQRARREVILDTVAKGLETLEQFQHRIAECADFAALEQREVEGGSSPHQALKTITDRLLGLRRKAQEIQTATYNLALLATKEKIIAPEIWRLRKVADASVAMLSIHVRSWDAHQERRLRELEFDAVGFVKTTRALLAHLKFDPKTESVEEIV